MKTIVKGKKHFILPCIMLLFIAGITGMWFLTREQSKKAEVSYEDIGVTTATIERTLTSGGEISYGEEETISFSTSKTFKKMYVEEGDAVAAGDVLAQYGNGTYLTADIDGVIAAINAPETGATATEDNSITLLPTAELVVQLSVAEDEIDEVAVGDEVEIIANNDTDRTFAGKITYISGTTSALSTSDTDASDAASDGMPGSSSGSTSSSSAASADSSSFTVIVTFTNDDSLKIGMSANCTVSLESRADVIAVPVEAVTVDGDIRSVNVLDGSGQTAAAAVETGISDGQYVEITAGLQGGEILRVERIGSND